MQRDTRHFPGRLYHTVLVPLKQDGNQTGHQKDNRIFALDISVILLQLSGYTVFNRPAVDAGYEKIRQMIACKCIQKRLVCLPENEKMLQIIQRRVLIRGKRPVGEIC